MKNGWRGWKLAGEGLEVVGEGWEVAWDGWKVVGEECEMVGEVWEVAGEGWEVVGEALSSKMLNVLCSYRLCFLNISYRPIWPYCA